MLATEGERRVGRSGEQPVVSSILRVSQNSSAKGISSHLNRGNPMSMVEVKGALPCQHSNSPARVSTVIEVLRLSLNKRSATQRMPLPHAPASEPSLLRICTKVSAWTLCGG